MIALIKQLVIAASFTSLSVIVVFLRILTRFVIHQRHGWDDYLIIAALTGTVSTVITFGFVAKNGAGQPLPLIPEEQRDPLLQATYASTISYSVTLTVAKLSMLVQFLRFIVDRRHKIICWVLISFNLICTIVFLVGFMSDCKPTDLHWLPMLTRQFCQRSPSWFLFYAILDILSDVTLCLFPMFILRRIRLKRREKYALILVFALGGGGCITSGLRTNVFLRQDQSRDVVATVGEVFIYSILEMNISIICACVPTLRPLMAKIMPGTWSNSKKSPQGPDDPESGRAAILHKRNPPPDKSNASDESKTPVVETLASSPSV